MLLVTRPMGLCPCTGPQDLDYVAVLFVSSIRFVYLGEVSKFDSLLFSALLCTFSLRAARISLFPSKKTDSAAQYEHHYNFHIYTLFSDVKEQ
jgi:hypothetical protein